MSYFSRSMLARRSRYLSGSVQSFPVFLNLRSFRVISEGFKSNFIPFYAPERQAHEPDTEYWRDLGQSSAFEGQILIDCIHRLHDDVLKVWNFNDPSGVSFRISPTSFYCR